MSENANISSGDLDDLAHELCALYQQRQETKRQISQDEDLLKKRELAITPKDGWPGKNANERQAYRDHALEVDIEYKDIKFGVDDLKLCLELVELRIEQNEALRRGAEYMLMSNFMQQHYNFYFTPIHGIFGVVTSNVMSLSKSNESWTGENESQSYDDPGEIPF